MKKSKSLRIWSWNIKLLKHPFHVTHLLENRTAIKQKTKKKERRIKEKKLGVRGTYRYIFKVKQNV